MKRVAIPAIVLILAGLAFWWFSPTQVLKRRTASFIDTARVPVSMSDLGRSARGRHLADYFAPSIEVESPENLAHEVGRTFTRDEAAALYSGVARYCREVSITDLEFVSVGSKNDEARVVFTADTIVDLPNRRPVDGLVTVESRWRKVDGDWLLEAFEWTESARP
jgi:hypothetical protein